MNVVSVLKLRTTRAKLVERESYEQDGAEPRPRLISLLSFLEAENIRLRQAVVELSLDTIALREELTRTERRERVADFRPGERRASRSARPSVSAQCVRIAKADRN